MRSLKNFLAALAIGSTLISSGAALAQPAPPADDDVEIEIEAEPEQAQAPVNPPPQSVDEAAALRADVARLEARLAELEARSSDRGDRSPSSSASETQDPSRSTTTSSSVTDSDSGESDGADERASEPAAREPERWWDRADIRVGGYLQLQLENNQLSQDELAPDGSTLNQNRFLVRRGRIRVDARFRYASAAIEIDGSTTRGPFVSLRRAEASFFYPAENVTAHPYVMATVGLSEVPFGAELRESNRLRYFMERSTASLAFFRGEPDVGARVQGALGPFRYVLAVMNGVPLDDRPGGQTIDFNRAKDLVGRFGIDVGAENTWQLVGGVSVLRGSGFHPGTEATKGYIIWRDYNENGVVNNGEEIAVPGQAATPSRNFRRWAVNADLSVSFRTALGSTRVYGEVTMASNLDRSYLPADPVATGYNVREFGYFAAVLQDVTRYGIVGFRYDVYDPDSDFLERRRGVPEPTSVVVRTYSPLVGVVLPGRGRLMFQYDAIADRLGRNEAGLPVDIRNNRFVLRLQMEL